MSQSINDETLARHPELDVFQKCKGKGSWYGILAIAMGGSLAHVAQQLTQITPKDKRIPITIVAAVTSGFVVSSAITHRCSKEYRLKLQRKEQNEIDPELMPPDPASLMDPKSNTLQFETSYDSKYASH